MSFVGPGLLDFSESTMLGVTDDFNGVLGDSDGCGLMGMGLATVGAVPLLLTVAKDAMLLSELVDLLVASLDTLTAVTLTSDSDSVKVM